MMYIKFSDKDTNTIIKNLSKTVEFKSGSSMLISNINPDFKVFCGEILEFVKVNRFVPFDIDMLCAIKQVVSQFSILSFSLPNRLTHLYTNYNHYVIVAKNCNVYGYFDGDKIVLNEDLH